MIQKQIKGKINNIVNVVLLTALIWRNIGAFVPKKSYASFTFIQSRIKMPILVKL